MSSSIAIPQRRKKLSDRHSLESPAESSSVSSFTSSSASPRASGEVVRAVEGRMASPSPSPSTSPTSSVGSGQRRRGSLLSPNLARCEHTVINVGQPDAPRLITCVKSSQGFDWNQDMFLPSHADYDFGELERKKEPVQDIILTDEEAAALLP